MKMHIVLLNTAPAAGKIGRWVRYLPSDLEGWLNSRVRESTSDDGSTDDEEKE